MSLFARLKSAFLIIFMISAGLSSPATASREPALPHHHMSGKQLLLYCNARDDVDYGYCAGYVSALAEIMLSGPIYGFEACNHGPVGDQQLMEIARDFLQTHKEAAQKPAALLIAAAFEEHFPCDSSTLPAPPKTYHID